MKTLDKGRSKEYKFGMPSREEEQEKEEQKGEISIADFVKFAHQLVKYTSKINGDIDLTDIKLENYKTKTTVFNPVIKKQENNSF